MRRSGVFLGAALVTCAVIGLSISACGGGKRTAGPQRVGTPEAIGAAATPDPWEPLRTTLHLVSLDGSNPCPVTTAQQIVQWLGPAQGDGPVYPVGLSTAVSLAGSTAQGGWFPLKTVWVSDASYRGRVLVRGRRLDGSGDVHFQFETNVDLELRLPLEASATTAGEDPGWRAWASETLVPGPGCYGLQLDGAGFSRQVVIEVGP